MHSTAVLGTLSRFIDFDLYPCTASSILLCTFAYLAGEDRLDLVHVASLGETRQWVLLRHLQHHYLPAVQAQVATLLHDNRCPNALQYNGCCLQLSSPLQKAMVLAYGIWHESRMQDSCSAVALLYMLTACRQAEPRRRVHSITTRSPGARHARTHMGYDLGQC